MIGHNEVKKEARRLFSLHFRWKKQEEEKKEEENDDSWAEWWKGAGNSDKGIKWKLWEKIILLLEAFMIIYFILVYSGLAPFF